MVNKAKAKTQVTNKERLGQIVVARTELAESTFNALHRLAAPDEVRTRYIIQQ